MKITFFFFFTFFLRAYKEPTTFLHDSNDQRGNPRIRPTLHRLRFSKLFLQEGEAVGDPFRAIGTLPWFQDIAERVEERTFDPPPRGDESSSR